MFCGETVPTLSNWVIAAVAEVVGIDTFWNWPAEIIAGETVTETDEPEAIATADLTTNERSLFEP